MIDQPAPFDSAEVTAARVRAIREARGGEPVPVLNVAGFAGLERRPMTASEAAAGFLLAAALRS
jgi:hypothetical protein